MCFVNWYGKTDNIAFCGAKLLNFLHHQCCYSNKHTWTKQNGKMGKSQNRNRSGLTPWARRRRKRSVWLKVIVLSFFFFFWHIEYVFGYMSVADICVSRFLFFFFLEKCIFVAVFSFNGSHVLFTRLTNFFIQQLFY